MKVYQLSEIDIVAVLALQKHKRVDFKNCDPYNDMDSYGLGSPRAIVGPSFIKNDEWFKNVQVCRKESINGSNCTYITTDNTSIKTDLSAYLKFYEQNKLSTIDDEFIILFQDSMKQTLNILGKENLVYSGNVQQLVLQKLHFQHCFMEDISILEMRGFVSVDLPATINRQNIQIKIKMLKNLQEIKQAYNLVPSGQFLVSYQGLSMFTNPCYVQYNGKKAKFASFEQQNAQILYWLMKESQSVYSYHELFKKSNPGRRPSPSYVDALKNSIKQDVNKKLKEIGAPYYISCTKIGVKWRSE